MKKTIKDISFSGKKLLVRVDFNVPLTGNDPNVPIKVADDTRIQAALPTLHYLLDGGAALILCSHLGRPHSAEDIAYSLGPVAVRLEELLGRPVWMSPEFVGEISQDMAAQLQPGELLLLENSRFDPRETKNDPELSVWLADLADGYVNDAFGTAHRAHATTEGVAQVMRAKGGVVVAGFLLGKEIAALQTAIQNPPHPYIAIMGGAKISDKIGVMNNLLQIADYLLIGGGMANSFLQAQGYEMGKSLVEPTAIEEAKRLLNLAGDKLILPLDLIVTKEFAADAVAETVAIDQIPVDGMALDVGPKTIARFTELLSTAKLVIWNGPMGVFEFDQFALGTNSLANYLALIARSGAEVIVGGGDSAAAVNKAGLDQLMSHVSTGGGASLELLEGKLLPGIEILDEL